MTDKPTKDGIIDWLMGQIEMVNPHEFDHVPKQRWRSYVEITHKILEAAQKPASIERFKDVCALLTTGFTVASKGTPDKMLEHHSWIHYGFRVLCANPKTTDWTVIDRDDSAITHTDKAHMLEGLYPLLRAMLAWANKVRPPDGTMQKPLFDLRGEVLRQIGMNDAAYWESAMSRKLFDTDSVTGFSQYNTEFFRSFIAQLPDVAPDLDPFRIPPPDAERERDTILCDLTNILARREELDFEPKKSAALDAAIRRKRTECGVADFDLDGLLAAVTDALSDNSSGRGLTMKMCDDLRQIVSRDWMVSVAKSFGPAYTKTSKTVFTPEEHMKRCKLIDALKGGFENRARKAATKDAAADWRNAAEMVSSNLHREALGDKEWEFLLALITNRRATPVSHPVQVDFLTKGTPAYRKFRRDLDGLIARLSEHLPTYPSCAKEYLDYLVALRDGTLTTAELTAVADLESRGIIVTEKDADDAMERLETNVRLCLQRLNFSRIAFEVAGQKGGKDLLGRYRFIQPQGLANGLCLFDPEVSSEVIVRNACPLHTFDTFEHGYDVLLILQGIEEEWERFFETVIVAVPGKPAFIAARNAYDELRKQLELQFGIVGHSYKPKEERQRLYEDFKEKLNDLAMTVFECDSQRPNLAPDPVDAASCRVTPPDPPATEESSVIPGTYAASFAALDPATRTLTITSSIRTKKVFTVPPDYFAAWKIVCGLIETTDPEGWLVFDGDFKNMKGKTGSWQGHFRHTSKPNAEMIELLRYIEGKPRGKRGTTCIRLLKHPRRIKKRKTRTHKRTSK